MKRYLDVKRDLGDKRCLEIKLLDLKRQYHDLKEEFLNGIEEVLDSQSFILGENVERLEEEIAEYCGTRYAVGVASGSDAILLSLMAIGIGPGDYVITSPYTFFATASSIVRLGGIPVFVDINPKTYNLDAGKLEDRLRELTAQKSQLKTLKAVIPVHLFGQCAEMGRIISLSGRFGLAVVEDAAQSIGAEHNQKRAGSFGDTGCLSFYPTKNLGCFGDGGMIVTNRKRLAERLKMLRIHGSRAKYYHSHIGINSRLDEIQAVVLRIKLRHLKRWEEMRITNARRYGWFFKKAALLDKVSLPVIHECNYSVFNQYIVRVRRRDALRQYLGDQGIGTEIYYPIPLHLQRCFKYLGYRRGDFPVAEEAARETIALPVYPELTDEEQEYIVEKIAEFYNSNS